MKGLRKVIIGLAFIAAGTFICFTGIKEKSELLGLASVLGALAAGVFGIIYGNVQEHKYSPLTPTVNPDIPETPKQPG